jgi:peptide/nickel transport system substrate-binding protein
MSPEFERLGKMFEQAQDFESRKAAYLELVAEWENQTPGMYLWRNVVSYATSDDLDWDPGNSATTIFGNKYLK